ncbi:MAG: TRAP-type C4-dicarboxylate transport system, substrate-binding protein, partial [bacterium]|nr:TRAP-type C4-dicarboxylate transport system, substrate-binding protein [bacterium]
MRLGFAAVAVAAAAALTAAPAGAEPVAVRMASMAPDGTAWARELKAYARDIAALSNGEVRLKLYLGGIAGDEAAVPERIKKGQLDGEMAAVTCDRMAPSLRVLRVPGLIRRRDEANYVIDRLRPTVDAEFRKAGFALLAVTWFGSDILFTKTPVRSMEELRKLKLWIWNLDVVWSNEMQHLGLQVVPLSVDAAGPAYDEGRVDGLLALPSAALVYQWSARSRFFTDLPVAAMAGCNFVSTSVFDGLPMASQSALRQASAKLNFRMSEANGALEDALIGGLFEKQGVHRQPASEQFRIIFFDAAKEAREKLPRDVVPPQLITQVMGWL